MRIFLILVSLFIGSISANARHHHRHHVHHVHHVDKNHHQTTSITPSAPTRYGIQLTTVKVASGQNITVAAHLAPRFKALVTDFVAVGYKPQHISCFARGGHVTHSRHYAGAACDFDGSLSRNAFMRTALAHQIIVKHGFRNGCTFAVHGIRDCGHVDDGQIGHYRRHRSRYNPYTQYRGFQYYY